MEHPVVAEEKVEVIMFNDVRKQYNFLSNAYDNKMIIDGLEYLHVDGYFQSQKHFKNGNIHTAKQIRGLASPMACRRIGNGHKLTNTQIERWNNELRDAIMKRAILVKFITNSELAIKLSNTGNAKLVENSTDEYWGCGRSKKGRNMTGQILMDVRRIVTSMNNNNE